MSNTNHYRVDPPFALGLSGGRSSAFMLRQVLDAWGGSLPDGGQVVFGNTGKEHAATYEFLDRIASEWCPVTWVEYVPEKPWFRVVEPADADRKGDVFASLIRKRKYLPNPVTRFCTSEMKVLPTKRYMASIGIADYTAIIGLRADEPRRANKLKSDPTRDIAVPMYDSGHTIDDVRNFWKQQPFDLDLPDDDDAFTNCDLCFLKGKHRLKRVMDLEPERAQWWIDMEAELGAGFRSDRPPYRVMLHQVTVQGNLFGVSDDETVSCDCTD